MLDIYRENILEHFKNPQNYGKLRGADISATDSNPLCGDEICVECNLNLDKIKEITFEAKGCALSIASASMLTEFVKHKSLKEIKNMHNDDIFEIVGINPSPARVKCILLPIFALREGIKNYIENK